MAMIPLLETIKNKASKLSKKILLPDATDERVVKAARILSDGNIVQPILVGATDAILKTAQKADVSLKGITLVDHLNEKRLNVFAETYYNMRKHKGMTEDQALETMKHPLYFAAMMINKGDAEGSVAGSISTTADVMRAGIQIVGVQEGIQVVSSFFLMIFPDGRMISFADCAVVPDPPADHLCDIAITTAANHRQLTGEDPCVAMLSFSTKGSAQHPLVDKVREATALARSKAPHLLIDGELQLDSAIIPSVGKSKAPGSPVAGKANVLVFPDLNAGNIGYKIAQRLAGAEAVGPVVQGLRRPFFDLSRGCSVEDIVNVSAINAVMGAV